MSTLVNMIVEGKMDKNSLDYSIMMQIETVLMT